MEVVILEYVVSRVWYYLCVKFDKVSMGKTWLINILPYGSVLTRHIWHLAGHVRTRLDISGSRAEHIWSPRIVSLYWVSTSHGFLLGLLHLVSRTHAMYSLMFFILSWRQWLMVMSIVWSIVRMLVLPQVVPLPSPTSWLRGRGPCPWLLWGLTSSWWHSRVSRWDGVSEDDVTSFSHQLGGCEL
jgi:hypothetical protein